MRDRAAIIAVTDYRAVWFIERFFTVDIVIVAIDFVHFDATRIYLHNRARFKMERHSFRPSIFQLPTEIYFISEPRVEIINRMVHPSVINVSGRSFREIERREATKA